MPFYLGPAKKGLTEACTFIQGEAAIGVRARLVLKSMRNRGGRLRKCDTRADTEFLSSAESYGLERRFRNFLLLTICFTNKLLEGCLIFFLFAKNFNRVFICQVPRDVIMSSKLNNLEERE